MTKEPRKNQDMSVGEILKSIKGIIDNNNVIQANDDILELTNIVKIEDKAKLQDKLEEVLESSLISDKSATETANIFSNFSKIAKEINAKSTNPKVRTLEEIIIDMLRPQLSEWLDKNLSTLVQQIVEREIHRLITNPNQSKIN